MVDIYRDPSFRRWADELPSAAQRLDAAMLLNKSNPSNVCGGQEGCCKMQPVSNDCRLRMNYPFYEVLLSRPLYSPSLLGTFGVE